MVKLGKSQVITWQKLKVIQNEIEVNMKKKILIAILVIALAITSVITLVACDDSKLNGKYITQGQENWYLQIEGDNIKYIKENTDGSQKVLQSGTFIVEGNTLKVTGFEYEVEFEISKDKKTIIMVYTETGAKNIFNKEN